MIEFSKFCLNKIRFLKILKIHVFDKILEIFVCFRFTIYTIEQEDGLAKSLVLNTSENYVLKFLFMITLLSI